MDLDLELDNLEIVEVGENMATIETESTELCEQLNDLHGEQLAELVVPEDAGDELVAGDAAVPVSVHLVPAGVRDLLLAQALLHPRLGHDPRHVVHQLPQLRLGDHTVVVHVKYSENLC